MRAETASYNGVLVYKKKGMEAWKIPYVYAGRSSDITIDRSCAGPLILIQGACAEYHDTFEAAMESAIKHNPGTLLRV